MDQSVAPVEQAKVEIKMESDLEPERKPKRPKNAVEIFDTNEDGSDPDFDAKKTSRSSSKKRSSSSTAASKAKRPKVKRNACVL
jgi:hypothetical protein